MHTVRWMLEQDGLLLLDIERVREEFPLLHQEINGNSLVYLDNAATTQKPMAVIELLTHYYTSINANIHRGIHTLAEMATAEFEATRASAKKFLNASSSDEIIFVKGVTEAVNLVASTLGRQILKAGDEVLISTMEHHSNIVPWQMVCELTGAVLKVIPINEDGELLMDEFDKLLNSRTKIVSIVHVSNALGTINPIKEIITKAHNVGAKVFIDGAQSSSHLDIDVQDLDCDFFALSGHKIYGPTGVGILYGKREVLDSMPPYQGGGEMIKDVTFAKTTYNELPFKFEAGTPNIGGVVALKGAFDFINAVGKENIRNHENSLLSYCTEQLLTIDSLKIIGNASEKVSIASFVVDKVHHQDLAILLDKEGVAVRTGHHCTQPLMARYGIQGTTRASFACYNMFEEVDMFMDALKKAVKMLR